MVGIVEPVYVCKVGVLAAELGRLVVHQLDEALDRAADVECKHICGVVAAAHEQAVEQVLDAHLLAGDEAGCRAAGAVEQMDGLIAYLNLLVEILAIFEHDRCRHYFSQRRGSRLLVRILFKDDGIAVEVDEQIYLRVDRILALVGQTFLVYRVIARICRH